MSAMNPTMNDGDSEPAALPGPVQRFLSLTRQLRDVLERENTLLEQRRTVETKTLAGEKSRLTAEYREALGVLKVRETELLGDPQSPIRQRIRSETDVMRQELARHAKLVIRLKSITEGVVRAIGREVEKNSNPLHGYGVSGRSTTRQSRPAALRLDENV